VIANLSVSHGDRFITRLSGNLIGHWSPDALERVIENLLTNALKYGDPTAPIVIAAGTPPDGAGNEFEFSVTNEGDPIPLAEQATMFQPFARAKSARRTGKPGWGIGLALVRALIEAHGGSVRIESGSGSGTTFFVRLPRDARLHKSENL
jgi:signal transduction histidine kinase